MRLRSRLRLHPRNPQSSSPFLVSTKRPHEPCVSSTPRRTIADRLGQSDRRDIELGRNCKPSTLACQDAIWALLRSCADDVTMRSGTVVPMPTSPRAEQSRARGPVLRHASGAWKITADHRVQASARRTVQAVASGPPAPRSHHARLPWPTSRSARTRPAARAAKEDEASSSGSPRSSSPSGCALCSDPAITIQRHWRQLPARMAGFGTTYSQRPPGGLEDDCQSGSLDRQVSSRIKWKRTSQPRACLSACRTASQPSYSWCISRLQRSARRTMPAHTYAGKQLQERQ
jgi:hypothetical protein